MLRLPEERTRLGQCLLERDEMEFTGTTMVDVRTAHRSSYAYPETLPIIPAKAYLGSNSTLTFWNPPQYLSIYLCTDGA